MKNSSCALQGSWRQALKGLQQARPSAMLWGLFAPAMLWLIVNMFHRFSVPALTRSGILLPVLAVVAVISSLLDRMRSGPRACRLRLAQISALLNLLYVVLFLLTLSVYMLMGALEVSKSSGRLPDSYPGLILALYVLSALAAALWSPRSLPISKADDEMAFGRSARWLPWLVGMQGALVGLGVFLGTFAARYEDAWSALAMGGLAALGASLCVTFGVLMLYRFVFLALHPIPEKVKQEFGLNNR